MPSACSGVTPGWGGGGLLVSHADRLSAADGSWSLSGYSDPD